MEFMNCKCDHANVITFMDFHRRMLPKYLKYQPHLKWLELSHLPCDIWITIHYFDNLPMSWNLAFISSTYVEYELPNSINAHIVCQ
jgi:hypothetical protein